MREFRVQWPKVISGVFLAIFVATAAWGGVFFLQMHRELATLRAQETLNQRHLAEAQEKLAAQQRYLERLQHDPALIESIIRQKLGYVRAEEFVFRFEDSRTP
ncbi:MAG TPA: septum formation initiator family protein [Candidatus Didemnitutus sp.]|nr:septum formation initiator family protein [Candidatus Didemnitutus sp.]